MLSSFSQEGQRAVTNDVIEACSMHPAAGCALGIHRAQGIPMLKAAAAPVVVVEKLGVVDEEHIRRWPGRRLHVPES